MEAHSSAHAVPIAAASRPAREIAQVAGDLIVDGKKCSRTDISRNARIGCSWNRAADPGRPPIGLQLRVKQTIFAVWSGRAPLAPE